jgi:hypothetical protein
MSYCDSVLLASQKGGSLRMSRSLRVRVEAWGDGTQEEKTLDG